MIDWLLLRLPDGSNNLEVFVWNLIWAAFAGGAALLYGYRLRQRLKQKIYDEATRLMSGIVFVGLGTAIHRVYWAAWRAARLAFGDRSEVALWFPGHADWVNVAILISCIGYSLHMYPVLHAFHGRWWWLAALAYGALWYVLGAFLGRAIH